MGDRESLSLCPMLPFMKKKKIVPSPFRVFGHLPSSTFLPDVSLLLINMDPIYKVHSAYSLPLTSFSIGPFCLSFKCNHKSHWTQREGT